MYRYSPKKNQKLILILIYKRYNINSFENEDGKTEYVYTEDQYTIPEYLKEVVPETEESLGELSMLLAMYQTQTDSAIAELSIALGGNNNV